MFKTITTALALVIATGSVATAATFDLSGVQGQKSIGRLIALEIEADTSARFADVERDIQILSANTGTILAEAVDTNTVDVADAIALTQNNTRDIYRNDIAAETARNELAEAVATQYQSLENAFGEAVEDLAIQAQNAETRATRAANGVSDNAVAVSEARDIANIADRTAAQNSAYVSGLMDTVAAQAAQIEALNEALSDLIARLSE